MSPQSVSLRLMDNSDHILMTTDTRIRNSADAAVATDIELQLQGFIFKSPPPASRSMGR